MNMDSDGTKSDPGNHSSAWNNSSGEWFSLFFSFNLEELSDHGVHPFMYKTVQTKAVCLLEVMILMNVLHLIGFGRLHKIISD